MPKEAELNDSQARHLPGLDILKDGTVYWVGYDYALHPYPSLDIYNSWHIENNFSQVVLANEADFTLPMGEFVTERILE